MIDIRRIRPGEVDLYRHVRLSALKDSPEAFGTTYESAAARPHETWRTQADGTAIGPDRATFFAFHEGALIGIAALYRKEEQEEGEMLQVWVSPDFRGTGVAAKLVEAVIDWGRSQGITRVRAGITGGNSRASLFYRKLGFIDTDTVSRSQGEEVVLVREAMGQTGGGND